MKCVIACTAKYTLVWLGFTALCSLYTNKKQPGEISVTSNCVLGTSSHMGQVNITSLMGILNIKLPHNVTLKAFLP